MMKENGNNFSLVLRDVTPMDFGNYTCKASNSIGEAETTVTLTGIPFGVAFSSEVRGLYRNSYNLTWTVKSFSPVLESRVRYKACGSKRWKVVPQRINPWFDGGDHGQVDTIDDYYTHHRNNNYNYNYNRRKFHYNETGSAYLEDLEPDCEYRVRVKTRNMFGWSDEETHFAFITSKFGEYAIRRASVPLRCK